MFSEMKTMSVSENFLKLLRGMMRFTKLELEDLVDCSHELWVEVRASLIAQLVKNPPAMQETPVQFLGQEDPLEKGQTIHSNILGLPLWLSC